MPELVPVYTYRVTVTESGYEPGTEPGYEPGSGAYRRIAAWKSSNGSVLSTSPGSSPARRACSTP